MLLGPFISIVGLIFTYLSILAWSPLKNWEEKLAVEPQEMRVIIGVVITNVLNKYFTCFS